MKKLLIITIVLSQVLILGCLEDNLTNNNGNTTPQDTIIESSVTYKIFPEYHDFISTHDGLIIGYPDDDSTGQIMKTDFNLNTKWKLSVSNNCNNIALYSLPNNNVLTVSQYYKSIFNNDGNIIGQNYIYDITSLTESGIENWTVNYSSSSFTYIKPLYNGEVVGIQDSNFIHISSSGIVTKKEINIDSLGSPGNIIVTTDNHIITQIYKLGWTGSVLIKLSSSGDVIWSKNFPSKSLFGKDFPQINNKSFVCGRLWGDTYAPLTAIIDNETGEVSNEQFYSKYGMAGFTNSKQLSDGTIATFGVDSLWSNGRVIIHTFSENSQQLSEFVTGDSSYNWSNGIVKELGNGEYLASANISVSSGQSTPEYWYGTILFKTDLKTYSYLDSIDVKTLVFSDQ